MGGCTLSSADIGSSLRHEGTKYGGEGRLYVSPYHDKITTLTVKGKTMDYNECKIMVVD